MKPLRLLVFLLFPSILPFISQAQPAVSRGEQRFAITYEEGMRRAKAALLAENYSIVQEGNASLIAHKDIHTAVIMCNIGTGFYTINTVVASCNVFDGGVPGSERVRLQERMAQTAPVSGAGGFSGKWRLTTVITEGQYAGTYAATLTLTERDGQISGSAAWDSNLNGSISGTLRNGQVVLYREDTSGFRATLSGRVSANGRMEGTGQNDGSSPGGNTARFTWSAEQQP